jgi:transcription initiation factor IIE alpha subunit
MKDDEKLVEKVAREVVDQHGPDAIPILRERAKAADMSDDALAAETWRDVAHAAERILQERDGLNAE